MSSPKKRLVQDVLRTLMQGRDAVNNFVRGLSPQDAQTVRRAIQAPQPVDAPYVNPRTVSPLETPKPAPQPGPQGLLGSQQRRIIPAPSQAPEQARGFLGRTRPSDPALNLEMQGIIYRNLGEYPTSTRPAPGVQGLSPLVQNRTPFTIENPLEGTQLDMFGGFNRLRYPAGTKTADGISIGGTTYSPNISFPENAYTSRVRDWARKMNLDEEVVLDSMRNPGPVGSAVPDFSSIKPNTGFFAPERGGALATVPANVTEEALSLLTNAAGGVQTGDLNKLLRLKQLLVGGGSLAAATQIPNVARRLFGEDDGRDLGQAPGVPNDAFVFSVPPEQGATQEQAQTLQQLQEAVSALQQTDALAGETAKALMPMSPERYPSVEAYRADQARAAQAIPAAGLVNSLAKQYAQEAATAAPKRAELADYMRGYATAQGMTPEEQTGLGNWALSNPTLAYRFQQEMMKRPDLSQQTGESVTTQTPVTQLGSDTQANVTGNVIFGGEAAATGNPGASDLAQATEPMPQPYLQRTQELIQRMAPRSRMYAGY